MVTFKMNEAYFDSYSVVLLQEDNAPQEQTSVARYNMKVELEDKAQSELILPLTQKLSADHVTVREDFVEEKLVVTMKGAASCLGSGLSGDDRFQYSGCCWCIQATGRHCPGDVL